MLITFVSHHVKSDKNDLGTTVLISYNINGQIQFRKIACKLYRAGLKRGLRLG